MSTIFGKRHSSVQILSVIEWGLDLVSILNQHNFKVCLMVWWAILGARNDKLWNGKSNGLDIIITEQLAGGWISRKLSQGSVLAASLILSLHGPDPCFGS